jgi:hypothetical protein
MLVECRCQSGRIVEDIGMLAYGVIAISWRLSDWRSESINSFVGDVCLKRKIIFISQDNIVKDFFFLWDKRI